MSMNQDSPVPQTDIPPGFQFGRAPDVSGSVPQGNGPGDPVDDVVKPWPFGWPPYLGVKLRMRVNPRRNSYPDNAGHW